MSFAAAGLSLVRPKPVTVSAGLVTPPDAFVPAEPAVEVNGHVGAVARPAQRIALVHGQVRGPDGAGLSAVLNLIDTGGRRRVWAFSSPDGSYTLSAPTPGTYVVLATAPGHRPHAATVDVAPGLLRHDAVLAPDAGGARPEDLSDLSAVPHARSNGHGTEHVRRRDQS